MIRPFASVDGGEAEEGRDEPDGEEQEERGEDDGQGLLGVEFKFHLEFLRMSLDGARPGIFLKSGLDTRFPIFETWETGIMSPIQSVPATA